MQKINNVSFEDWVCAKELLYKGLTPQKVYDILNIDKATWHETDKLWEDKYGELWSELNDKRQSVLVNPFSYSFAHITEMEVEEDLRENGEVLYLSELEIPEIEHVELPKEGLTLKFLKEQDEYEWVDLINKNILNKIKISGHDGYDMLNKEEYIFYSIICLIYIDEFQDYYDWHHDLVDDIEENLAIIGAKKYVRIVEKANNVYRKVQKIIKDNQLEDDEEVFIEGNYEEFYEEFSELDYDKPLKDILLKYVKKHLNSFVSK